METPEQFCTSATPILRIVGYVVFGIKVVVPIILIIIGMVDLAKAVAAKEEKEIKTAQQGLVKKAIAAVLVFLVVSIVGVLMGIIGDKKYKKLLKNTKMVIKKLFQMMEIRKYPKMDIFYLFEKIGV